MVDRPRKGSKRGQRILKDTPRHSVLSFPAPPSHHLTETPQPSPFSSPCLPLRASDLPKLLLHEKTVLVNDTCLILLLPEDIPLEQRGRGEPEPAADGRRELSQQRRQRPAGAGRGGDGRPTLHTRLYGRPSVRPSVERTSVESFSFVVRSCVQQQQQLLQKLVMANECAGRGRARDAHARGDLNRFGFLS